MEDQEIAEQREALMTQQRDWALNNGGISVGIPGQPTGQATFNAHMYSNMSARPFLQQQQSQDQPGMPAQGASTLQQWRRMEDPSSAASAGSVLMPSDAASAAISAARNRLALAGQGQSQAARHDTMALSGRLHSAVAGLSENSTSTLLAAAQRARHQMAGGGGAAGGFAPNASQQFGQPGSLAEERWRSLSGRMQLPQPLHIPSIPQSYSTLVPPMTGQVGFPSQGYIGSPMAAPFPNQGMRPPYAGTPLQSNRPSLFPDQPRLAALMAEYNNRMGTPHEMRKSIFGNDFVHQPAGYPVHMFRPSMAPLSPGGAPIGFPVGTVPGKPVGLPQLRPPGMPFAGPFGGAMPGHMQGLFAGSMMGVPNPNFMAPGLQGSHGMPMGAPAMAYSQAPGAMTGMFPGPPMPGPPMSAPPMGLLNANLIRSDSAPPCPLPAPPQTSAPPFSPQMSSEESNASNYTSTLVTPPGPVSFSAPPSAAPLSAAPPSAAPPSAAPPAEVPHSHQAGEEGSALPLKSDEEVKQAERSETEDMLRQHGLSHGDMQEVAVVHQRQQSVYTPRRCASWNTATETVRFRRRASSAGPSEAEDSSLARRPSLPDCSLIESTSPIVVAPGEYARFTKTTLESSGEPLEVTSNFTSLEMKHRKPALLARKPRRRLHAILPTNSILSTVGASLSVVISIQYIKLVICLGFVLPVSELLSPYIKPYSYQAFYLYLYFGSILFMFYINISAAWRRRVRLSIEKRKGSVDVGGSRSICQTTSRLVRLPRLRFRRDRSEAEDVRFGSVYLRLGVSAFGIGSMVYSGLEIAREIEQWAISSSPHPLVGHSERPVRLLLPACRAVLTILQIHFILFNDKASEIRRQRIPARLGLAHMIATNLCEWLGVVVQETRHEIIQLNAMVTSPKTTSMAAGLASVVAQNVTDTLEEKQLEHESPGRGIVAPLLHTVAPLLSPCTIEYSLICAVILFEMWKEVGQNEDEGANSVAQESQSVSSAGGATIIGDSPVTSAIASAGATGAAIGGPSYPSGGSRSRGGQHVLSADLTHTQRGAFLGVLLLVLTILGVTLLSAQRAFTINLGDVMPQLETPISLPFDAFLEAILSGSVLIGVIVVAVGTRKLALDQVPVYPLPLDLFLLISAQTSAYIYSLFVMLGCIVLLNKQQEPAGIQTYATVIMAVEALSTLRAFAQTHIIIRTWHRRAADARQAKDKPGRQAVTFLIFANICLWAASTFGSARAQRLPHHMQLFGIWPWTAIAHACLPLTIFLHLHSSICLFEVWKNCHKLRPD